MKGKDKTYHHGDLRNALKRESARIIAERGLEGFSLREASRRAGVSAAAAYRHFPSKEALVEELVIDGRANLRSWMERRLAAVRQDGPDPLVECMRSLGRAYVDFAGDNPNLFRILTGPVGGQMLPAEYNPGDPYNLLQTCLTDLRDANRLRDPDLESASLAVWSMMHGLAMLVVERILPNPTATGQATVDEAVDVALDALTHGVIVFPSAKSA